MQIQKDPGNKPHILRICIKRRWKNSALWFLPRYFSWQASCIYVCVCVCVQRTHLHVVDEIIGVKTSAYIYDRINPRKYRVHRHKRDRYKYMTTVYTKSTPLPSQSRQESSFVRIVIYGFRRGGWLDGGGLTVEKREKSEWYRFILATLASSNEGNSRLRPRIFWHTWTNTFFFFFFKRIFRIVTHFFSSEYW